MAGLIYLASPFTHANPAVREHRYLLARTFTIDHLRKGLALFSPIVYGKDMESAIGTAFEPWAAFNDAVIQQCREFWVLTIDGWSASRGVKHELQLAADLGKPVVYKNMAGETLNADHRHDPA